MNKVVVISGGTDGLGRAIAETLSKKNKVVILSPTEEKLKKVSKKIGCEYEVCDVSDYIQIEMAVKNIVDKYETVDVLINNAALWIQGELDDNDPDYIKQVIEVNTLGA